VSARREASAPPVIPGYEHSRLLGMGGFADVFLYEQQMPKRSVAVKVLLASALGDDVRARFRTEADVMAKLSHHPSIVTIYLADVAPDGRPFLVMEYCSRAGLGERYRAERMGVAEILRIGVRLASAVETAHRAGILHRDIKPANVLITDFGWPALTDFGIAATTGWSSGAAIGMSIPWSPPEMLAENPTGDVRADVYSLAATVYSMLARRSPFEIPGGSNTAADLVARIGRSTLAGTGRPDAPDSLQAVLVRAMDPSPARRYHSALAFARALQHIESELMLPVTTLDLPDELSGQGVAGEAGAWPGSADADPAASSQETRLRPIRTVSPDLAGPSSPPSPVAPLPAPAAPSGAGPSAPAQRGPHEDGVPTAWRQGAEAVAATVDADDGRDAGHRGRVIGSVAAGIVIVAVLIAAAVLVFRPGTPKDEASPASSTAPTAVLRAVPAPTELAGVRAADGSTSFTWTNPEPLAGDLYLWGLAVAGKDPVLAVVDKASIAFPPSPVGTPVCVEISIKRADGRYSTEPAVGCSDS